VLGGGESGLPPQAATDTRASTKNIRFIDDILHPSLQNSARIVPLARSLPEQSFVSIMKA
jgi:hypothetical protein